MTGGIITTGAHPKALWPGVYAWWGIKYNEHPLECLELFEQRNSGEQSYEELVESTGTGLAPIKVQGDSISYDSMAQGTISRFTHVTYGLGAIITREAIEDNLYPKLGKQFAGALAFSMRQTKENVAAGVYNRGFNSNFPGGDGQAMISKTHPSLSGSQSNHITVSADFSEIALESLLIQVADAKNSRGLRLSLMPQTLHIPPQLIFDAERVLSSTLQSGTSNNDVNALNSLNKMPGGIKVNHYLTDPDAWFIRTNCPEGMLQFNRRAVEMTQDNDFDTENAKMKTTERYSLGVNDWRGIYGSPGA